MPLAPVTLPGKRSRAQELYVWLRAAIIAGELRAHERLVETSIAALASVSRTPVREALHRLEVDGLVREGEGGGLEVCGFSLDELADLCAVRETLEGMATELAAVTRSETEIATLRAIVQAEEDALASDRMAVEHQVELNHSFHETLWRASRNRYLADQLRLLRGLIERMQDTTLRRPDHVRETIMDHSSIVDAVEARDSEVSGQLARQHFRRAMAARLGNPPTPSWPATAEPDTSGAPAFTGQGRRRGAA